MPKLRVAVLLSLCLLAVVSVAAQDSPVHVPAEPILVVAPPQAEPPEQQPEQKFNVFKRARGRMSAQADISGTHGELLLDSATAPSSGVLLQAFAATPDIFLQLGTSTSASAFRVLDVNDTTVFTVAANGFASLRRDQDTFTALEINNANPGSASAPASTQIRFFEGTTLKARLGSYGAASTGVFGGANALQLLNLATGPIVLGTSSIERMRIHADGNITVGDTANVGSKLAVFSGNDGGAALLGYHNTVVETNATQNDWAVYGEVINNVASGVMNAGSVVGGYFNAWNFGPGGVAYMVGNLINVGNYADKSGSASNATGVQVRVVAGSGTVQNGYGVMIEDVQAATDFGIYQIGADDANFFAGSVGIGAVAPAQKFHVLGTDNAGTVALVENNNTGSGAHAALRTTSTQSTTSYVSHGNRDASLIRFGIPLSGWSELLNNSGNGQIIGTLLSTPLVFGTANTERVRVLANGNVGIGITAPTAKLHVAGDVIVAGNITGAKVIGAVYQDLAEWVPASTDMAPGTVVVLNVEKNNEVMPSWRSYDTTVAGVVSAAPGIILGIGDDTKEQIATTGRVKVRVDARSMPVRVGDLLVTSDVPGTAMKSEPIALSGRQFHQPGTIIGKALEPLESGIGEILVLLSMQ